MAALALWLGQWMRRETSPDELFSALAELAPDTSPQVLTESGPQPLTHLLAALTAARADAAWVVLPRPGGPGPLPVEDGHAVQPLILVSAARRACLVIAQERGAWSLRGADRRDLGVGPATAFVDPVLRLESGALAPRAARRRLLEMLSDGTERLRALALDRPTDRVPGTRWSAALSVLPDGIDADAAEVLQRAALILDALDMALSEDGSAVTAREATLRRRELLSLSDDLQDLVVSVVNGHAAAAPASMAGQAAGARPARARRR